MSLPEPLQPSDPLNLDWLNGVRDGAVSGQLKVDPRTGLKLITTPFGSFLRSIKDDDGWFLVTASGGSGQYTLVSQIEAASGGWTTGPRTISAYEANLNASVPSSSTVRVWASCRRGQWRFTYGACS
jgi:hypothetical protein